MHMEICSALSLVSGLRCMCESWYERSHEREKTSGFSIYSLPHISPIRKEFEFQQAVRVSLPVSLHIRDRRSRDSPSVHFFLAFPTFPFSLRGKHLLACRRRCEENGEKEILAWHKRKSPQRQCLVSAGALITKQWLQGRRNFLFPRALKIEPRN